MLTPEQIAEGWIEHDGGPCPVAMHIEITPLYRDKEDPRKGMRRPFGYAGAFDWAHDGEDDDIIAYRPEPHHD